jgi:hypothetical protein
MFTSGIYRMLEGRTVCFGQSLCEAVLIFPIFVWPRELIKTTGFPPISFELPKGPRPDDKILTL